MKATESKYYIDYIYDNPSGANFYHQLVRRADNAILYANPNLDFCKNSLLGIGYKQRRCCNIVNYENKNSLYSHNPCSCVSS